MKEQTDKLVFWKALCLTIAISFVGLFLMSILCGCMNTNIAWRGVTYNTEITASTEGKVTNTPTSGDSAVAADKEYEQSAAVSQQGSASASTTQKEAEAVKESEK